MGDFEFGSQEHIDGLSRKALEADFRFVIDRMREAECEWERLKAENAKLRELAEAVKMFVEDSHCEDCPHRRDCYDNNRIFCANTFSHNAFAAMRELGIEAK